MSAQGVRRAVTRTERRFRNIARTASLVLGLMVAIDGAHVVAQSPTDKAELRVPSEVAVPKGAASAIDVNIVRPGALPPMSFVRVTGLPETATLSQGYRISASTWAIPIAAVGALSITVPGGIADRTLIEFALMALDGEKLAGATVALTPERPEIGPADGPVRVLRATPAQEPINNAPAAPVGQPQPAPGGQSAQTQASGDTQAAAPKLPADNGLARPAPSNRVPLTDAQRRKGRFYLRRGDQALRDGNVNTARLFYKRAAEIGLSLGARALAETFDPREISRLGAIGLQPDAQQADFWYARARELREAERGIDARPSGNGPVARQ
ncbi:MAG: hypothetical protein AAFV26_03930 [Pseudomonadota bacterium]